MYVPQQFTERNAGNGRKGSDWCSEYSLRDGNPSATFQGSMVIQGIYPNSMKMLDSPGIMIFEKESLKIKQEFPPFRRMNFPWW